ncbi:MAG: HipA domain-containing protein [Flavobacteriales bacterium]|nr:HipA domain-containing protein [Flavobacteriales bacterium]
MGILYSRRSRGHEIFSFQYNLEWIGKNDRQLDPDLKLYKTEQYLDGKKENFGIFSDSAPDRWGKLIMDRREAWQADSENRISRKLFQTDYLLGVHDGHRMGALRFKLDPEGDFLDNNDKYASPPGVLIRELEEASLKFENDELFDDPQYEKWIEMLLAPGASLGGARPKASVKDSDGNLWIAKFPSINDQYDHGAWEYLVYQLAMDCRINMAECKIQRFSSKHHTFMTKRFDRTSQGNRIHFASAMTMLGYSDGLENTAGASYLEIAEFLMSKGSNVKEDLEELFKRIVFTICVSNCDDHLRNHGFLLNEAGWRLSPAYDINANETGMGLILNISLDDNRLDLRIPLSLHYEFRLTEERAHEIIRNTVEIVSSWQERARKLGISGAEIKGKSRAFQVATNYKS